MSAGRRGPIRDINQCPGSAGVIGDMPERPRDAVRPLRPTSEFLGRRGRWTLWRNNVTGDMYAKHPTRGTWLVRDADEWDRITGSADGTRL